MDVQVYASIREIDESEWDSIVKTGRIICTHRFLRAVEESGINDCRYYYHVIRANGRIIAHTCTYTISTELDIFVTGVVKSMINLIRKVWTSFLVLRTLECGTPVALGNTLSFVEGSDPAIVLAGFCTSIESLGKRLNVPVVLLRDFYDEERWVGDSLLKLGYRRFRLMSTARLDVKWGRFDDYVEAMRKHYRNRIRNDIRRRHEAGVTIRVDSTFADKADVLERLWRSTFVRAKEYKREMLTTTFFEKMDGCMGERSRVLLMCKGDVCVAFALLLRDDEVLRPLFGGMDYAYGESLHTYFNLLIEVVRYGVDEGFREIDLGVTTLEPKKYLGAHAVPLHAYVKHSSLALTVLLAGIFTLSVPRDRSGRVRVFTGEERSAGGN